MIDEITIIYNIKKLREFPSIPIMYSSKYVTNSIKKKTRIYIIQNIIIQN